MKQYAQRPTDEPGLDELYSKHVSAMTSEGLHSKTDIAAELAWRDMKIGVAELEGMANVRDNILGSLDVAISQENEKHTPETIKAFQDFRDHIVDQFGDSY